VARKISIIIPSYNDERILRAINSVRFFDDGELVSLVVVDGGSRGDLIDKISNALCSEDVFISEPDRGIFDGLNKGLDLCLGEIIGWIGSDDIFTGNLRASEVVELLDGRDILFSNSAHFRAGSVTRITYGFPARVGLGKFGLNPPHFGTFGRRSFLASRRFDLSDPSADIDYFLSLLSTNPRAAFVRRLTVLAEEGGFSTFSRRRILSLNFRLMRVYARYVGPLAPLSIFIKLAYKAWSAVCKFIMCIPRVWMICFTKAFYCV
jgi:glycosyltransferase involved in cell wall biosynthesis